MGRHVNADGPVDDEAAADAPSTARHAAEGVGHPLEPQNVLARDTHVGVDLDAPPAGAPDAVPSPAHPDALIEHGRVGDGHELE